MVNERKTRFLSSLILSYNVFDFITTSDLYIPFSCLSQLQCFSLGKPTLYVLHWNDSLGTSSLHCFLSSPTLYPALHL